MSQAEVLTLVGGFVFIFVGWAALYRYTLSPKAGERMAAANRRYKPRPTELQPLTPAMAVFIVIEWTIFGAAMQLLDMGPSLGVLAVLAVVRILVARRLAHRREGDGSRP